MAPNAKNEVIFFRGNLIFFPYDQKILSRVNKGQTELLLDAAAAEGSHTEYQVRNQLRTMTSYQLLGPIL